MSSCLPDLKNNKKYFVISEKSSNFASQNQRDVSVAQLVEQLTLNQWVEGSSPSGYTEKVD